MTFADSRYSWRARAIASDTAVAGGAERACPGDQPGRFAARVRALSTLPNVEFRKKFFAVLGVLFVSQGITGALRGQSKTVKAAVSGPLSLIAGLSAIALATMILGRYVRMGIRTFRIISGISAALLTFIIYTGSAVRLTGSGLGCPDWPTCSEGNVVPESGLHAQIEFGNRIVTGLCVLVAGIGVLTALVRNPYRRDLVQFGLLVSLVIFGNAIVGGLTVLSGLRPEFVMAHFILALMALGTALLLFHRAGEPGQSRSLLGKDRTSSVDDVTSNLSRVLTIATAVVLFMGMIVTGAGPHGGSDRYQNPVERFPFSTSETSFIHSLAVWIALLLVIVLSVRAARSKSVRAPELRRRLTVLMGVIVVQGAIGYTQYFTGVPALLVQFHIVGATAFFISVFWVRAAITIHELHP
jgi:heme a synthase